MKPRTTILVLAWLAVIPAGCGLFDDPQGYQDSPRTAFVIEGTVTDTGGVPMEGIVVRREGEGAGHIRTDGDGDYSLPNNKRGYNYRVRPDVPGWTFEPDARHYPDIDSDHTGQDFAGTPIPRYDIGGRVLDEFGGPIQYVKVVVSWGEITRSVFTDEYGFYRAETLVAWEDYTLIPKFLDYAFEPSARSYDSLDQSYVGQDFTAYSD
jgi:hypothetical protein